MRRGQAYLVLFTGLTCALLTAAISLMGQSGGGSISGVVTDPSHAAVPGASVTLRGGETGLVMDTTSNSTGKYSFPFVPVGKDYTLTVKANGFKTYAQSGITLLVNEALRVDAPLQLGSTQQSVEVSAQGIQVATENTAVGDVIESNKMVSLPLNGRSYVDLLGLQAGVVPQQTSNLAGNIPTSGLGSSGNFSMSGARETANSFLINGGIVEETKNNGAGLVPDLDSIEEFKVITNGGSAEYGQFSGGIVTLVTKGGTNSWHGEAFDFLRNDNLDSRNFFDPSRGLFEQNQFGGTLGGPIIKNRLFVFGDYQGSRQVLGVSSGEIVVPSATQRQGDESALISPTAVVKGCDTPNSGCLDQVLSQRLGYAVTNGEAYFSPGCTSNAQCVFPSGIIPQAAWSPAALNTLKFIPLPTPGLGGSTFSTTAVKQRLRDDKYSIRGDLDTQRTGRWAMYWADDDSSVLSPYPNANVPGFASANPTVATQAVVSNTITIGTRNVNEVHLSFFRVGLVAGQPKGGLGSLSSFGFQTSGLGIVNSVPAVEGVPVMTLANMVVTIGPPNSVEKHADAIYEVNDNISMTRGRHTFKFGADYQRLQLNRRDDYASNGKFDFNGSETGGDFADYLVGAPDSFFQASPQALDSRSEYGGVYAQDSYRVKPSLNLSYGLRWEVSTFWRDKMDRNPAACRIQTILYGEQSVIYPTAPTGWLCAGDPGVPQGLAPTGYKNFAPRIGIGYSPNFSSGLLGTIFGPSGKSSIRAAYGLYYGNVEDNSNFFEAGDAPTALFYFSPVPVYLEQPFKARRASGGPGQRFPYVTPDPKTANYATFQPIGGSPGVLPNDVLPRSQDFNLSFERQLGSSTLLTVAYVGTVGHHLTDLRESNPGSASLCLATPGCGPFGEDTIYNLGNGNFVNGTRLHSVTSGRYLSQGVLDFSYDQYIESAANSVYNSLQVTMQKRVGAVTFLGAYTWSKSIDNSSVLGFSENINPFNSKRSRAISSYDVPQNFVASYSWNLPFQKLVSSGAAKSREVLGGWQLSGITRFAIGVPIYVGENDDNSLCGCAGLDYPNWSGQPIQKFNSRSTLHHQYFSTATFSMEQLGVPGNASPRLFHGPGLNNFDMALHKVFKLRENMGLEYRAEFFNAFNHAQFVNPYYTNINQSNFGQVTNAASPRIMQMALKLTF